MYTHRAVKKRNCVWI